MPQKAIGIGLLLILLGLVSYLGTGMISVTALIPSFFGLLLALLGILAKRNESIRKHAMHGALLLALLGIFGSFDGIVDMFGLLTGNAAGLPVAAASKTVMTLACLWFLIMGIKSFRDARRS